MISKSISYSVQIAGLNLKSKLIFTWCIPYLDDYGLINSDSKVIKAMVFPMSKEIRIKDIEEFKKQAKEQKLVEIYQDCIEFTGFSKHQTISESKKARSKFQKIKVAKISPKVPIPNNPQESPRKPTLREEKRREDKLTKEKIIYMSYLNKINKKSVLTDKGKENIKERLQEFSTEQLLQAIDNKSKDTWFRNHNRNRGITWFFGSKKRMNYYVEETPSPKRDNIIS